MSCQECEEAIYTYREQKEATHQIIQRHIAHCPICDKLFKEVQLMEQFTITASKAIPIQANPKWLTNRIMSMIEMESKQPKPSIFSLTQFFDSALTRYSLSGVSIVLLLLFFIELGNIDSRTNSIKGPMASLQRIVIDSRELRKDYANRKFTKRSRIADCTKPLSTGIDLACIKEKSKNLIFKK